MAKKLYTLRDIVELLNEDLEKTELSYRYTEQSVRARLRYLQSKAAEDPTRPMITPKVLGYDRRTNYYTEEDVRILRELWTGPMLAEFDDGSGYLDSLDPLDTREVRPAGEEDFAALIAFLGLEEDEEAKNRVFRMLKEPNAKTFVAIDENNAIVGWGQAKIAFGISVAEARVAGAITFYVAPDTSETIALMRSLTLRTYRWLIQRDAQIIVLEVPSTMAAHEAHLRALELPKVEIVVLDKQTPSGTLSP